MQSINTMPPSRLYNMLQDMRHLVILDLRSQHDFDKASIINSFNIQDHNTISDQVVDQILNREKQSVQFEQKYQYPKIRRLVFVFHQQIDQKYNLEQFKKMFDKVFMVDFTTFIKEYPFLCVSQSDKQEMQSVETDIQNSKGKCSIKFNKYLFAQSRFPTQINSNLFIGSVLNANNKQQLDHLGITFVVDLVAYKIEKDEEVKYGVDSINYGINLNDKEQIVDLDTICMQIEQKTQNTKVLLVCLDGDQVSPAMAVAYLKYQTNKDINVLGLTVFQKKGIVRVDKPFYSRVISYQPIKKPKEVQQSMEQID